MYWDANDLNSSAEPGLERFLAVMARSTGRNTPVALAENLRERQLAVLRGTYPAWDIAQEHDWTGKLWWTAVPKQSLTVELVAAGVVRKVRCEDPIALATALAWRSALICDVENSDLARRACLAQPTQELRA
ncbi:hypothetical protein [Nonomuraea sp. NPDC049309]|uniref:hypothetical protein n=1 Tax=Nonomuraea sp. NPDC049309 TaxID=3364350 RepID=UPI003716EA73